MSLLFIMLQETETVFQWDNIMMHHSNNNHSEWDKISLSLQIRDLKANQRETHRGLELECQARRKRMLRKAITKESFEFNNIFIKVTVK